MIFVRHAIVDEVEKKTAELNQALVELLTQAYDETLDFPPAPVRQGS
jgi:hypothetical protein